MKVMSIDPGAKYVGAAVHEDGSQLWVDTLSPFELEKVLTDLCHRHQIGKVLIEETARGMWSDHEAYHVFRKAEDILDGLLPGVEILRVRPGEWKPFAHAQGWHKVGWRRARGLKDQHQHDAVMLYEWWRQASV